MTHASVFSGIGGAEIAAHWMGWRNIFHCEINDFCRKVLRYHFPDSESYEDITGTDFTKHKGQIDVLTGGFPCQPFSYSGRRRGEDDDRFLWREMLRAIREVQPHWVVCENVAGILTMVQPDGYTEMDTGKDLFGERRSCIRKRRYILAEILNDIERSGYSVQTFVIPACAVGAPHRRERVWIVANANEYGNKTSKTHSGFKEFGWRNDAEPEEWCEQTERDGGLVGVAWDASRWRDFPTQPPILGRDDGLSERLDAISFSTWTKESIRAYGNAWAPQVAYEIFKAIERAENET